MNRWVALGLLAAASAALALRCPQLDRRPMHNDEAVNAVKFGALQEHGSYRYDPDEHHGPTLYYATLALARLTGAPDYLNFTESRLRLVTVLFGAGLILLLALIADGLGRSATGWAAVLTAVSPAMVFYSRYYIHEMLLVFFALLTIGAAWRYWRSRKAGYVLLAGAGLGLMHATKETFVITLAALVLALMLSASWDRWIEAPRPSPKPAFSLKLIAVALGLWLVVALILFSSFFSNASGPLDSVRTYLPWLHRAGGESPHIHPWHFYLHRLAFFHPDGGPVWTEGLILALAAVGFVAGFTRRGLGDANAGFVRFLALYTGALTVAYSLISYKTPWCLLSFWNGAILLAGVGAARLVRAPRKKWGRAAVGALLVAGAAQLAWQAWQAGVPYAADRRNPYVYAQTSHDIQNLAEKVEALAKTQPQGHDLLVKVIAPGSDYWPLPWYLRAFKQVGWWDTLPTDPFAPVMIVSSKLRAGLDEKNTHVMAGYFELRPQVFMELYVQLDLWRAYLESERGKSKVTVVE